MNGQRFVIVGAGPAGLNAIEVIRALDQSAEITLISHEPVYSRMVLPYFLTGKVERDQLFTGGEESFNRLEVELKVGVRAEKLDPNAHTLKLSDGEELSYDKLLLATGSTPILPPVPGINSQGVHTFWTLRDAEKVLRSISVEPEVLMIGAGFVGLIVLSSMYKMGWRLHVAEMLPQILPRMLDEQAAALASRWLQDLRVDVLTGVRVTSIEEAGNNRKRVNFEGAPAVEVDLVIVAAGVKPSVALAESGGLEVDNGILVDSYLQTSQSDIYAAGDVAQGPALLNSGRVVNATQPTATDHGRIAGANMTGKAVPYPGCLSINILDIAGLSCVRIGEWEAESPAIAAAIDEQRFLYRKLAWRGNRLVGALLIGPSRDLTLLNDIGMVKGLIQSQADLGVWRRYLEINPWDVRRPFTAARIVEKLLKQTLLSTPSWPRVHRYLDLQPIQDPRASYVKLMQARPERLDLPIANPPLR